MKTILQAVALAIICIVSLLPGAARAQDADLDGMPDSYESAFGCLMPYVPDDDVDYDTDGLTSLAEYTYSPDLNPCLADTDGDGKDDGLELAHGSNPLLDIIAPTPSYSREQRMILDGLNTNNEAYYHSLWTGSEYIVKDDFKMFSLDAEGTLLNQALNGESFVMAWSGTEIITSGEYIRRYTPDLQLLHYFGLGYLNQIEWTGSEFGGLDSYQGDFFIFTPTGGMICDQPNEDQICDPINYWGESYLNTFNTFEWTGSEFAVFSYGYDDIITMTRLSPTGELIDQQDLPLFIGYPIWTGNWFLSSYGGNIFQLSPTGTILGSKPGSLNYPYWQPGMDVVIDAPCVGGELIVIYSLDGTKLGSIGQSSSCGREAFAWNGTEVVLFNYISDQLFFTTIRTGDDWDGDHLEDADETDAGTDPQDWDTDGDGVGDGYEVEHPCLLPLVTDGDGDGDGDGIINRDEFLMETDACNPDMDGDGLDDLLETTDFGTDPLDPDTDGDGLNDGWEAGVVVAAGPNGVIDTAPAAGDSLKDGAIWLGTDMVPNTAATDDDIQIIPLALPCVRLFLSDPVLADTDSDGVDDDFELMHGSNPTAAAIVPTLVKTVDTEMSTLLYRMVWTGSEYLGLTWEAIITPECQSQQYLCKCNLLLQRLDRFGRPAAPIRTILANADQYAFPLWTDNELWIDARDADGPLLIRLNAAGDRVAPDRHQEVDVSGGAWNGSQLFSNTYRGSEITFHRYNSVGELLGTTVLPDRPPGQSSPQGFHTVWTGSEYGVPLATQTLGFARISTAGNLISLSEVSDLDPFMTLPVWTGSEYVLSFSEGTSEASGFDCDSSWEGCQDVSVLLRLDAQGQPVEPAKIVPTPGASTQGGTIGWTWLAWDGNYLVQETPDFSSDSNGYCDGFDCENSIKLHWLTPSGDDIGPPVSLGVSDAWHTGVTKFAYGVYPISGSTADPAFMVFAPDSDGDGIPDEVEVGGCTSAANFDSDFDGVADSLEDPDSDGLIGAADPAPCAIDGDGDGLTDAAEIALTTDPLSPDTDGDGLGDAYELSHPCLDPIFDDRDQDPDLDDLDNLAEFTAGTNPCVADTDSDGMDDGWEMTNSCMDPLRKLLPAKNAGFYNTPGNAIGVSVSGDYAYVADFASGLQIINVSNPTSLTLAGTYNTPGDASGVYVSGDYAYVADYNYGLQIIDVSNPAAPTLAGTYNTPEIAYGIFVSGDYAYVADVSSLQIINVSNPASPTLAGTYANTIMAQAVYVSGDYAYVADYSNGLLIINVSNPASPTLAGTYNTPGYARSVYVSGDYAYVADDSYGLQVINVSNPASPVLAGTYNTPGTADCVYVSGNYAYVADYTTGLLIFDVSNPANPAIAGGFMGTNKTVGVYVSGGEAYLAESTYGFRVVSVFDQDRDGLSDPDEYGLGANPCAADTDGDTFKDGVDCAPTVAAVHPGQPSPEGPGILCDGLDNQCPGDVGYGTIDEGCPPPDADGDGLSDGQEIILGTNPHDPDTDHDGVNDGDEVNLQGTNPLSWDTDGDALPDGYEVTNLTGHTAGIELDPIDPVDGGLDFDGDGNANVNEYWNGTNPWIKDPVGGEGCFFWGDATGDGFIGALDITILTQRIKGPADYSRVIPNNGETQDLDDNGFWGAIDTTLLTAFAKSESTEGIATRPSSIEKLSAATASVQVGNTTHVTVALRNLGSTNTVGFGVVFSIDPSSTGTAVILGGDGANGSGYRYDITGAKSISARSNVVILVKTAGTIKINAGVPQCGMLVDRGRYCAALTMTEPFVITGY